MFSPTSISSDKARAVDQFFACYLGNTAAEMKDPGGAAASYSALYTNAVLDALCGVRRELFGDTSADGKFRYLMTRTLQKYLENEVPVRVLQRGLQFKVNQNPDAIVTSNGLSGLPHYQKTNKNIQSTTHSNAVVEAKRADNNHSIYRFRGGLLPYGFDWFCGCGYSWKGCSAGYSQREYS